MRRYLAAIRLTAAVGLVVGAAVGLRHWSSAWPLLSLKPIVNAAAIGWLAGVAVGPFLGWLRKPHPETRRRPRSRWARAAAASLTVLAIAPAALWAVPVAAGLAHRETGPGLSPNSPNLILITIDALRADHLGAYGSAEGLTPNLDAFAEEATVYESAYASSPWTLTSFGSTFSSLAPSQCGLKIVAPSLHDWYLYSAKLPEDVRLFPEDLQKAGYSTGAELTNCFLTKERGWGRGFDSFRNEDGPELGAILTRADTITENSLAWLHLNPSRPFFFWAHYLDPHVPYNSPETPPELRSQYPADWLTRREYWYGNMFRQDAETRKRYEDFCRSLYAEEVRYADEWVGRLLDGIREADLWDGSLIVISADHGEELFDHGGFEHGHTMHDELLHVPMLVKWPAGTAADHTISQVVGLSDLAQTLLSAAGLSPSTQFSGRPLPRSDGGPAEGVYSEGILHGPEQTALTTEKYRAIWRPKTRLHPEETAVYDRKADPTETEALTGGDVPEALLEQLRKRSAQAAEDSARWKASGKQEFRGIDLSHATREKLRTLGYIGD